MHKEGKEGGNYGGSYTSYPLGRTRPEEQNELREDNFRKIGNGKINSLKIFETSHYNATAICATVAWAGYHPNKRGAPPIK